jgi:RNA polymerase sigma-70 factor (sigma-E family)
MDTHGRRRPARSTTLRTVTTRGVLYGVVCGAAPAARVDRLVIAARERGWMVHIIGTAVRATCRPRRRVINDDRVEGGGMRDGDAAFAEYFAARSDAMRRTAYLLCGDWHRAEDLVQIAFTKLYLAWGRVNRHEVLDAYLRQTLIRTFLDERRRGWWRRERTSETPADQPLPADTPEDRLVVLEALAEVPPRQRAVLVLRYWEDLSIEETAAVLGCTPGTVKSQSAKGLHTLRGLLTPIGTAD